MRPIVFARHLVAMLAASSATPDLLFSTSDVDPRSALVTLLAPIGLAAAFALLAWLFFTETVRGSLVERSILLAWIFTILMFLGAWSGTEFGHAASVAVMLAVVAFFVWRLGRAYWDR